MKKDIVLFPVNHGGHWTLGVWYFFAKSNYQLDYEPEISIKQLDYELEISIS